MSHAPINPKGRRVVVTGAGGFLGARLVARLTKLGCEVVPLGRAGGFRLMKDAIPMQGVDHVFHLAAETGVPDSWQDPARFHLINSHGTVRVLDQCRLAGCSMTYVGAYIYGVPTHLPIDETHPLDPNNPYAFSKWMGEQACAWFAQCYSIPVTAIRLFNVYGPGQSTRFLIPSIVAQVLDPAAPSVQLMDLAPRRDYLFVDDAVDALLASWPLDSYALYNVGNGTSHSVGDVAGAVMQATGISKPVEVIGEPRRNEIPDVRADCSRLAQARGWKPRYSLVEGIAEMLVEERT